MKNKIIFVVLTIVLLIAFFLMTFFIVNNFLKIKKCSNEFIAQHDTLKISGDIKHCDEPNFTKSGYELFSAYVGCTLPNGKELTPETCIIDVAEATQNISVCNGLEINNSKFLPFQYVKYSCFDKIKDLTSNPQKCYQSTEFKDSCLGYVAGQNNDFKLCETITNQQANFNNCITPIAIKSNDINICTFFEKLGNTPSDKKNGVTFCFLDYAKKYGNNIAVCDKILSNSAKEKCLKEITPLKKDKDLCGKILKKCEDIKICEVEATGGFVGTEDEEKIKKECNK
ncbi:MAG: hypothetical protein UT48_C0004G0023 [Parcubacteria group bacterium GW2011_GWE2_39_37]|uniref:Transmembrane protein n=1 Tax=Candidatus Falkowbacteria bacterium GW2011_GWF2_39_8 TaxID=1618642 RepID=A0A0G0T4F8_9BACT|nr:MAG: hypothetical protein UT48_C0004G0023 [Parcubacteria group bacterium GW2011_GWE2_39_37]KKR32682.1 MAG: hypothetical protein UT64_C0026G0024 [Candidatus Falkowbacteria bacterium GW2011_GWF2_39_8]